MKIHSLAALSAALLLAVVPSFALSTVQLKSGTSIEADVIAEKPDRIVVDLGFTVITVPRDEIESLKSKDDAGVTTVAENSDLYRVAANLGVLSVKENVDRVGEAVVLVRTPVGLGSGFFIHPSGYIITNEHVIAGEYNITVTQFRRGATELEKVQYSKVRIVALDSRLDLALLKIEDAGDVRFPTVPIGDGAAINDGQTVFAIGSPLGLDRTVSQGIVSARTRPLDGQLYIQTTTQINPGNSGGPLFNLRGEVVGVNNMKAMEVGVEGLNFAIPTGVLKNFLRNRDAFAFDPRNPNAGYRYLEPPQPVKAKPAAETIPAKP
ncbi:MAG: trypsin-like peptidase domain-containing protein [Opitutaceae bacterium]|jgi:serine protease Do